MIRLPGIRDKGPGPLLGARHPGEQGPFGRRPDPDDLVEDDDQDDHDRPEGDSSCPA